MLTKYVERWRRGGADWRLSGSHIDTSSSKGSTTNEKIITNDYFIAVIEDYGQNSPSNVNNTDMP